MSDTENVDRILSGLAEVADIEAGRTAPARVFVPMEVDVKAIRGTLGLSQSAFAMMFGFSLGAVQDWEQRRRKPDPAARMLLRVIEREPAAVMRALAGEPAGAEG